MNDLWLYLLTFGVGLALGLFYFGGLWLTVRQLARTDHPALVLGTSFVARLGLTLLGFYLVAGGHWQRLLVAILGFFLMRLLLVRRVGRLQTQRS